MQKSNTDSSGCATLLKVIATYLSLFLLMGVVVMYPSKPKSEDRTRPGFSSTREMEDMPIWVFQDLVDFESYRVANRKATIEGHEIPLGNTVGFQLEIYAGSPRFEISRGYVKAYTYQDLGEHKYVLSTIGVWVSGEKQSGIPVVLREHEGVQVAVWILENGSVLSLTLLPHENGSRRFCLDILEAGGIPGQTFWFGETELGLTP